MSSANLNRNFINQMGQEEKQSIWTKVPEISWNKNVKIESEQNYQQSKLNKFTKIQSEKLSTINFERK